MNLNFWKWIEITVNRNVDGGLPFGSRITRFPGLVGNDMMMMDSMGWPYRR